MLAETNQTYAQEIISEIINVKNDSSLLENDYSWDDYYSDYSDSWGY